GVVGRGGTELEVLGAFVVQDPEAVALVVDVQLDTLAAAGAEHDRVGGRVVGGQVADLAGDLAVGFDQDVPLGAGQRDPGPEPLVGFGEDHLVGAGGGADGVPPHLVGAPGVVDGQVEQRGGVGGPGAAVEDVG